MFSRADGLGGSAPSRTEIPPSWLPWLGIVLLAALLQSAFPGLFGPATLRVSMIALCILWFGFAGGPIRGAAFGALAGLIEDALGASALSWMLSSAICGALAGLLRRTIVGESIVFMGVAAAVLTYLRISLFGLVVHAENSPASTAAFGTWPAIAQSAVTGLAAMAVLAAADRIESLRGNA